MLTNILPLWHDCYMLMGTAAATLLGLLFVAMSLRHNPEVQSDLDRERTIWGTGSIALTTFGNVLLVAILCLVPAPSSGVFGGLIIALGVLTSVAATRQIPRMNALGGRRFVIFAALPLLGQAGQCLVAITTLQGDAHWLGLLALANAVNLLGALIISWTLLSSPVFARLLADKVKA